MPFSWDDGVEAYAAKPIGNPAAYEATMERARAHLRPDMRVLEVGCGTGMTARLLVPSVAHVTGTDISEAMIRLARRKAAEEGTENVAFERHAMDGPPLSGEPFDAVMAFNVLHLADDLDEAVRALARRVRPGGLAITKTPCLAGAWSVLWPVIGTMRMVGKAPRVLFLGRARLERAFRDAGFEVLEAGDYPRRPPSRLVIARRS